MATRRLPKELGRSYEALTRVNSQSGKGGISYVLGAEYGIELPRRLQVGNSQVVQRGMDVHGREMSAADLGAMFESEYRLDGRVLERYRLGRQPSFGLSESSELSGSRRQGP